MTTVAGHRLAASGRVPAVAVAGAAMVLPAMLFAQDLGDLAGIWWTSSTYAHCLLILPISLWLAWTRRRELAVLAPAGWLPGLLVVAAGALVWLCGELGGAAIARHLGLIAMLQGTLAACLGPAITRGLLFPLAYLLFLVPVGEGFEPPLQLVTARMSGRLLALTGIPAQVDGVFITTRAGLFEVAEACSGVKFLIAMLALAALGANLGFRSWRRRVLFVAAAAALPVLANAVRAWGTIAIAERIGADAAGGIDHLVYGWIFFGLVIGLLLAAAWPFFDRPASAPAIDPHAIARETAGARTVAPVLATAGVVLIALSVLGWSAHVERRSDSVPSLEAPAPPGWRRTGQDAADGWQPRFAGGTLRLATYAAAQGQRVTLALAGFGAQRRGLSAVGYGQGASPPGSGWTWMGSAGAGASRIAGPGGRVRVTLAGFRIGDVATASDTRLKLETLRLNLLGASTATLAWIVSADEREGGLPAIRGFAAAAGLPAAPPAR